MPWIKLDDSFITNAKIMQAGIEARALYVAGLCHCGKTLSDGAIPRTMVAKLAALADVADAASAVARLVDLELWHVTSDGYAVHDYLDYNPTRQQAESNAAQRALSGAIGGKRSGAVRGARAKQNRSNLLRDDDATGTGDEDEAKSKQIAKQTRSKSPSKREANCEAKHEPVSRIPYPVNPLPDPVPVAPTSTALPSTAVAPSLAPQAARDTRNNDPPQTSRGRDPGKLRRAELVHLFESRVWPAWPLKRNKQQAQVAFVRLFPADDEIAAMIAAIPVQSAAYDWPRQNWRFVPYLSTWLNQRRWEDDPSTPERQDAPSASDGLTASLEWLKRTKVAPSASSDAP